MAKDTLATEAAVHADALAAAGAQARALEDELVRAFAATAVDDRRADARDSRLRSRAEALDGEVSAPQAVRADTEGRARAAADELRAASLGTNEMRTELATLRAMVRNAKARKLVKDDFARATISAYGSHLSPIVKTPHIDALRPDKLRTVQV